MKAVIYESYGAPAVLKLCELEAPEPGPNEVRIRVRAVEVTKADCELRSFRFPVLWFWLPLRFAMGLFKPRKQVLGSYFAGEVDAVGGDASLFKPGDCVFGCAGFRMGAYAEYLCLPENYTLALMPDGVSFTEAAALPLGGLNALHFLNKVSTSSGSEMLIIGAGGSIGLCALQMAVSGGARVTAVDHAAKEQLLRSVGAADFVDYRKFDVPPEGRRFDCIMSTVARSSYSRCVNALNPGGTYAMVNPRVSDMIRAIWTAWFSDRKAVFEFAPESSDDMHTLSTKLEAGEISAVLDGILPIEQIVEAHERVESEQRLGAVIVTI